MLDSPSKAMNYYSYFTLATKIVSRLLGLGSILVAADLSIGNESESAVVRDKVGGIVDTAPLSPVNYFVANTPQAELYSIVARKCEWI
jgi:hypothetical protein